MVKFSESERHIVSLFSPGNTFEYQGNKYRVEISGKPTTNRGEPKTDIYVKSINEYNDKFLEFKISFKQENADFLENKITEKRAEQIFGVDWAQTIHNLTTKIQESFESKPFVYKDKFRRTQAGSITLGWKFELLNKPGGDLSDIAYLKPEEVIEVYSGRKLEDSKRHANVNGDLIKESGVANCVINCDALSVNGIQEAVDNIVDIDEFAYLNLKVYFACKALNYRTLAEKYDGNRPLAVYIDWKVENSKLTPSLIFDTPLKVGGKQVVQKLLQSLNFLDIKDTNDINSNNIVSMNKVYETYK